MTVDDALMNIQEIEAALLNDYRDKFYANIEKADNDCWIWKGGSQLPRPDGRGL